MIRPSASEAIGSFLLFVTVVGSGIMAERLAGGNVAIALLGNTFATGAMLFVLYAISTLYHSVRNPRVKAVLQKCDHSAIYLLIAGSYTPFTLVTLRGPWGWSLFGVSWGLAALGIVQELTLGRRTRSVSMVLYVLMGWLALVAVHPLLQALPAAGTAWLVAGGVIYSAGIYFFINDERIRHGHGIWHLFVLAGSLCQFVSVARYVA